MHALFSPKLGDALSEWICTFWKYLEEQTLLVLRYLTEQALDTTLTMHIATLSRAVTIHNVSDFVVAAKVFS